MTEPNQGQHVEIRIPERCRGWTVEAFFQTYGRSISWKEMLDAGEIHLNHTPTGPDQTLGTGDVLAFFRKPWVEPNMDTRIDLLHRDAELLLVDKPAGIPVTPSGPFMENTVLRRLSQRLDLPELSPLHRLDLETSGVLALATVSSGRGYYQRQFADRSVHKTYLALVHGGLDRTETISLPLGPAKNSRIHTKLGHCPQGKACHTEVEPLEKWGRYTLVRANPKTGRRNQIRAHLALIGHPIVGDKKYDSDEETFFQWLEHRDIDQLIHKLVLPFQALHSQSITLTQRDGQSLTVTSKLDRVAQWREAIARRNPI